MEVQRLHRNHSRLPVHHCWIRIIFGIENSSSRSLHVSLVSMSSTDELLFCPTCANLCLLRQTHEGSQLWCRTCPYVFNITKRFASKGAVLHKKQMQDVLGGADAWKDVAKTEARCPSCNCKMAYFRQMQIRSADEPMTTFYKCVDCGAQWKED